MSRHCIISIFKDQWDLLSQCLRSLEAAPTGHPLYLFDTGSNDQTVAALHEVIPKLKHETHYCRVESLAALNAQVIFDHFKAPHEFAMFLNSDTITTPGAVGRLFEVLEQRPQIAMVAPASNTPADLFQYRDGFETQQGTLLQRIMNFAALRLREHAGQVTVIPYVAMSAFALHFPSFLEANNEPGAFPMGHFYDLDICCRMRRRGKLLAMREDTFIWHRGHGTYRLEDQQRLVRHMRERQNDYSKVWGHMPEHQELLQRLLYSATVHPH